MTDRVARTDDKDARLRQAFQALSEERDSECAERDKIWDAISGELPPEERRDLVDHLAVHASCAEAWRLGNELWKESQAASVETPKRSTRAPWWLAAAAVLVVGVAVFVAQTMQPPPNGGGFRQPDVYLVESLVPDRLARDAFLLRWIPGPAGSRYSLRVTSEDLTPLVSASDLSEAEYQVAPERLAELESGGRVFWLVEVTLPDGQAVRSQTFITVLE